MTAYILDSGGELTRLTEDGPPDGAEAGNRQKRRRLAPRTVGSEASFIAGFNPLKGASSGVIDLLDVGLGKPFCVQIAEIYTGRFPKFWTKTLLVTTAVKSKETFDAQPRALNFFVPNAARGTRLSMSLPTEKGTPYAFYSPALISRSLSFQIEFVFDEVPDECFTVASGALKGLAGIPMFIGAAGYMMAGASVINFGGNVLNALFDHRPAFRAAVSLNINSPGVAALTAGWYLLTGDAPESRDAAFDPKQYRIDELGCLVGVDDKPYSGDMPYATILVDGTERKELASFAPTSVSADLLTRFFGNTSLGETGVDALLEATKLYSDMHFLAKAKEIGSEYAQTKDAALRKRLQEDYEAVQKNIVTGDIRKTLPPLA